MKRYYRNYKNRKKQKKYNEFKDSTKMFTDHQIEIIKNRIEKVKAILIMEVGEYNAKRLSTYPRINNGITHKAVCANCKTYTDLIRFDNETSLCENCAKQHNLI